MRGEHVSPVKLRKASFRIRVAIVLNGIASIGRCISNVLTESVNDSKLKAIGESSIQGELSRIVIRLSVRPSFVDIAEADERPVEIPGQSAAVALKPGQRSIDIDLPQQVTPLVADICNLDKHLPNELALNGDVVLKRA